MFSWIEFLLHAEWCLSHVHLSSPSFHSKREPSLSQFIRLRQVSYPKSHSREGTKVGLEPWSVWLSAHALSPSKAACIDLEGGFWPQLCLLGQRRPHHSSEAVSSLTFPFSLTCFEMKAIKSLFCSTDGFKHRFPGQTAP